MFHDNKHNNGKLKWLSNKYDNIINEPNRLQLYII